MRLILSGILLGAALLPVAPVRAALAEKWLKIQTPHFTVLTPGSEASARQWASELEQFEVGLQRILPVAEDRLRPVTVVLFRTDKALRPFKPLEKGKPQNIAGFFAKIDDSQAIALAMDYPPDQMRGMIYHEAVHWHIAASDKLLPPWLEEGLAEVYSTFKPRGDGNYTFGAVIPDHVSRIQNRKLMPLEALTTIAHGSLQFNEGSRATLFYAESWAFVHYLLFGGDAQGMDSITRYLQVAATEPGFSEAFRKAFGTTYAEADKRLAKYLHGGSYQTYTYRMATVASGRNLVPQVATEGEVELAFGVLLLGARGERSPDAVAHLQRAAKLMPSSPEVWQALGEAALQASDYPAAENDFDRAVAAGSTSYFVYYGRGATRMRGQVIGSFPDTADRAGAARDLRRAIELNPRFVAAYEALAGLMPALENPDAGDQARLEYAGKLAPDSAILQVGVAVCNCKAGRRATGRHRLELVLLSSDPAQREARQLAQTLLKDDDWGQFNERLEKLFKERRYAELVAAIDAGKNDFTDRRYREALASNRRMAETNQRMQEAVELANAGHFAEARVLLEKISADESGGAAHSEARRLLRELDKLARSAR